jgi:hypothetical protein
MNSLTELNGFVNGFSLPYTDVRLANVIFDRPVPINQTQTVNRGFTIPASIGIDIDEILNAAESQPTYSINVSSLTGATITWASLPAGVTVTEITAGQYVVSGFTDTVTWDLIKSPTIDFSDDFVGSFTYTSSISYYSVAEGGQTVTWTTAVTVNNILFFTPPGQSIYDLSAVDTIDNEPQLGNLDAVYPTAVWTVTITPSSIQSINTFTTTGTGGSFSVNASTKVITISGTRAQVNSRLAGLQIDANAVPVDFVLVYLATNSINASTDTVSQILISQGLSILGSVSQPTIYYNEDTSFLLTGSPLITDVGFDGTGNYVYTITPSTASAINTATFAGSGGSISINSSTKVITVQGTRSQVNARLSQITITPGVDFSNNFNLTYAVSTPRADTGQKIQVVAIGSSDTEVININLNRSYVANNYNLIFSTNTPQISDLDATNPTYTVILDCSQGQFKLATTADPYVEGVGDAVNNLSITGTKTFVNSQLSKVTFFPDATLSNNLTMTYTQFKNSLQQVVQSVALIGSAGTYSSKVIEFTVSQNYTPNIADFKYAKVDRFVIVGGGGGGAGPGGGGGGGGVYYTATDFFLSNTTYSIVLGAGGSGGVKAADGSAQAGGNGGTSSAFGISVAGGGGAPGTGAGGNSGAFNSNGVTYLGVSYDHGGRTGGSNNSGGFGGGAGHVPNGQINATTTRGGNGEPGPGFILGLESNAWGGGGGGGGSPTRGSGDSNYQGQGATNSIPATSASQTFGGGGGGGFGGFPGAAGSTGRCRIYLVQR